MTQFAIWFSVPSVYVYMWDESAMTCLQFVFSVPSSGYVHSDDQPAMKCYKIGCFVPGRYGYLGMSQSYHVLKLGVLYLVDTGIF